MLPYRPLSADLFLVELALTQDAVLLDVRTARELSDTPPLEGAEHLDYLDDDFDSALDGMDVMRPYFIYDDGGRRALLAVQKMSRAGFLQLAYLVGGQAALKKEGLVD